MFSQTVSIPDAYFLNALIEEGIDTNGDSLISTAEAEATTILDITNIMGAEICWKPIDFGVTID
ncbi:MAG: hypothetical protein DRI70_06310 [Bacteroidetes bacterium]|nr:MAG: hypothetical protein DRI70_06310 [Bacteroidota bacterium]